VQGYQQLLFTDAIRIVEMPELHAESSLIILPSIVLQTCDSSMLVSKMIVGKMMDGTVAQIKTGPKGTGPESGSIGTQFPFPGAAPR
jgi:hypothetical protein